MSQLQAKSYTLEVNQEFSITVEGDLSNEELQTSLKAFNALPESIPEIEMDMLARSHDRFKRFLDQLMDALIHQSFRNKKSIKPLHRYFSKLLKNISEIYEGPERLNKMALVNLVRSALLERLAEEEQEGFNKRAGIEPEQMIREAHVLSS